MVLLMDLMVSESECPLRYLLVIGLQDNLVHKPRVGSTPSGNQRVVLVKKAY